MKVERKPFLAALERVKPAVASSGSIQELKHIWVDDAYFWGYNGALGIRVSSPLEGIEPCGLPGSVLLGLLQGTEAKEIDLEFGEGKCVIKVGRSTTTLSTLDADRNPWQFPRDLPKTQTLSLTLTDELKKGLSAASAVRASKPVRVDHYGIILFPSKDTVALYSTDSKVLAEIQVKGKLSKDLQRTVLPHGFVSQLFLLKAGAEIIFTADAIVAEDEDIQVCSNLLDSSDVFDLPSLVSETVTGDEKMMPFPDGFGEGLGRGAVLAGSAADEAYVTLTLAKKELKLAGKFTYGALAESFDLKVAPAAGKITVGLEDLKALRRRASSFAIAEKALVLRGEEGSTYLIAAHEG